MINFSKTSHNIVMNKIMNDIRLFPLHKQSWYRTALLKMDEPTIDFERLTIPSNQGHSKFPLRELQNMHSTDVDMNNSASSVFDQKDDSIYVTNKPLHRLRHRIDFLLPTWEKIHHVKLFRINKNRRTYFIICGFFGNRSSW